MFDVDSDTPLVVRDRPSNPVCPWKGLWDGQVALRGSLVDGPGARPKVAFGADGTP